MKKGPRETQDFYDDAAKTVLKDQGLMIKKRQELSHCERNVDEEGSAEQVSASISLSTAKLNIENYRKEISALRAALRQRDDQVRDLNLSLDEARSEAKGLEIELGKSNEEVRRCMDSEETYRETLDQVSRELAEANIIGIPEVKKLRFENERYMIKIDILMELLHKTAGDRF